MKIIEAHMSGPITWSIYKDDPPTIPLQSLAGWSLINPLLYPELLSDMSLAAYWTIALCNDTVLLKTNLMLFSYPGTDEEAFKQLSNYPYDFLPRLRLASKQPDLARIQCGGLSIGSNKNTLPGLHFPDPAPNSNRYIQNHLLQSAVTKHHIERADANILKGYLPLYQTVLLDAVLAFWDRDDRRAILYAAMAIEILVERKLKEANKPRGKGPRKESTIEKLLHRQAKKIHGKSLKDENPELYHLAEKLYRTRNKIVHEGNIPTTDEYFQIDSLEARITGNQICPALICTCDIFAWFGEQDDYMPSRGEQEVQVPVGSHLLETVYPVPLPRICY